MVLERKKRVKEKRLRDRRRHPLEKPSGNHGPSNKPVQHTFRKIKRKMREERTVTMVLEKKKKLKSKKKASS